VKKREAYSHQEIGDSGCAQQDQHGLVRTLENLSFLSPTTGQEGVQIEMLGDFDLVKSSKKIRHQRGKGAIERKGFKEEIKSILPRKG